MDRRQNAAVRQRPYAKPGLNYFEERLALLLPLRQARGTLESSGVGLEAALYHHWRPDHPHRMINLSPASEGVVEGCRLRLALGAAPDTTPLTHQSVPYSFDSASPVS